MPNQRAPGQKLVPFAVDEDFIRELDASLPRAGYQNRSQFIRDAIVEKLTRAGVAFPKELAFPPHRFGKPSPQVNFRYPPHRPSSLALNESAKKPKRSSGTK